MQETINKESWSKYLRLQHRNCFAQITNRTGREKDSPMFYAAWMRHSTWERIILHHFTLQVIKFHNFGITRAYKSWDTHLSTRNVTLMP